MMPSFYNTTRLLGKELEAERIQAMKQEDLIETYFKEWPNAKTPCQVHSAFASSGFKWPLTSVRRAINTLTKNGILIKTKEQKTGLYGKKAYCWKRNIEKTQLNLF